jgi:hypothetical protein
MKMRVLLRLSSRELAAFLTALPLVGATRAALWILPSGTIVRRVSRLSRGVTVADRETWDPELITWAVRAASRLVPMATCLTQAVAAQLLLVRSGHASEICVGVARDAAEAFRAHAWVELQGRVVLGAEGVTAFSRLPSFGGGLGPHLERISR